jgi:FkbM family methyltransferase
MKRRQILRTLGFPALWWLRAARSLRERANWRQNVVGGTIRVRTSDPAATFWIPATSVVANVAFAGNYEPEVTRLLRTLKLQDGLIVNIGANVGIHAVSLAHFHPRNDILAIEPNPEAAALLVRNAEENGFSRRIEVRIACISDQPGDVTFSIVDGQPEYGSIGRILAKYAAPEQQREIKVRSCTLAEAVGDRTVALILMDIEGAEQQVLESSADVLRRDGPIVVAECSDSLLRKFGGSASALRGVLERCGYTVRTGSRFDRTVGDALEGNILALPNAPMRVHRGTKPA